ncbi:MAG TPA: VWA domain-containing protein [Candidatus Angelobacter sp.]|nr:VWA domain-containing protein [Candidatus Angelobacter sp.]
MNRWPGVVVFFLLAWFGGQVSALAQTDSSPQPEQVFRVRVELVVVDAQVLNKKTKRPVEAMRREDFQLYENGIRQQITSFSQDELPLSLVFLFDLTDSVRPVLQPLAEGALRALQHLKPQDEAAVMVYAASAQMLQDFTTDRQLIVNAIQKASRMESREAAFFNQGVFQAALQSERATNPASRRVIVWFTDNIPNIPSEEIRSQYAKSVPAGSIHTEKEALNELFKSGAVVCTMLERSDISESEFMANMNRPLMMLYRKQYPPGDVYKYSQETGGQVFEPIGAKQAAQRLSDMIDQIRHRYALGYRPSISADQAPAGQFYQLQLKVTPEAEQREGKLIIKTRRGFYR